MSEKLINLSPDLKRLREDGYTLETRNGYLIVHDIPYVTSKSGVASGALVTDLTLNNDRTQKPSNHQVWFTGEYPCHKDGRPIQALRHTDQKQTLCDGLSVNHRFSCKPTGGYSDYYEKMTRYIEIINNPARALEPNATACKFKPVIASNDDIFLYTDTASSRYGISGLSQKCSMNKVAIVGLGGTGSYILDLIAKTHIKEIHLLDGDKFIQHNAFRAPGATSVQELEQSPSKVSYYTQKYSQMRKNIIPHEIFLDDENIDCLADFDFVFMCVDKPAVRKLAFKYLAEHKIPFIDSGMEVEHVEEYQTLIGTCRATLSTSDQDDHLNKYISVQDSTADDIYDSNIQVAELNCLNATLAVIKWKKYCGFYQDIYHEHQTTYTINTHQLSRDETKFKAIK